MNETIQMIRSVINALNGVEVKGYKNLDAMLGCMQALDEVIKTLAKVGDEDG